MDETYLCLDEFPEEFLAKYPRGEVITRNAAECPCCGDIIESARTHDYKSCGCGAIAVDGGTEYLRRSLNTKILGVLEIIDRSQKRPQFLDEWEARLNRKWKYLNT